MHTQLFKNLVRQEATPAQKDYWKEIIRYGVDDNFPLRLARMVQNSATASSCIDTKADFIAGNGFSDSALGVRVVNQQKQTFQDVHIANAASWSLFEGFAVNVKYDVEGRISELYNVPFEYCRFKIPDENGVIRKILVNPYYGTGEYRPNYTKEYDTYNPDRKVVLAQQAAQGPKYRGQIAYIATTNAMSRFYPNPAYFSGCQYWMQIEEAIGGFHKNNIDNGFFQSVLFKMIGDPDQPSSHPDDQIWNETRQVFEPDPKKTIGMRFSEEMQKFSGWEKAGNIMVQWAQAKDQMPELQAFPSTTNSELFKTIQDLATEIIARATKVPAVLANIQSGASLGGDGNNIRASVKLMQQRVIRAHATLQAFYNDVLRNMQQPYLSPVNILHYDPYPEQKSQAVDPLIWAALTLEEQRNWIKNNTQYEILQPVTTSPASTVVNSFKDVYYSDYPASAKEAAQKAKDYFDKLKPSCGGKAGWALCDDIISGRPLSFKQIKRIYNYLSKTREAYNARFSDSCDALLFSAWGGMAMFDWAEARIKSINE